MYAGGQAEDIFGLFSAEVRFTAESSLQETSTETNYVSFFEGYETSWDEDVVRFQGTLFQSYEYEILEAFDAPALSGERFTIDLPVDAQIYKWSVPFYNEFFGPDHAIGGDVLPHTVGDPASYFSKSEVEALLARYVGWSQGPVAVGLSGGTNSIGIELVEENTSETQRSLTTGVETDFKSGRAIFGASAALTSTDIYTFTFSELTAYEGVVGDIADPNAWNDSYYEYGLAAIEIGMLNDGANHPRGVDRQPFKLVTWWTEY